MRQWKENLFIHTKCPKDLMFALNIPAGFVFMAKRERRDESGRINDQMDTEA